MRDTGWLTDRFEEHRPRLRAVAYRMLGSHAEAEDALQESWLRVTRAGAAGVENIGGWLTTVVARQCLNMLRSRTSRREEPLDTHVPDPVVAIGDPLDPAQQALVADAVGLALLVVLESLDPAERLALVLHDMFAVPFDEIAPIVGRTPAAARQLASRARRRVRQGAPRPDRDLARQREVVDAWLAASRAGDFDALVALLDPDAVLRVDGAQASRSTCAGRRRSPARPCCSRRVPGMRGPRSSTGRRATCPPPADVRRRCSRSRSSRAGSIGSTSSPIPSGSRRCCRLPQGDDPAPASDYLTARCAQRTVLTAYWNIAVSDEGSPAGMHPSAPGHLSELRRLAGRLFDLVCEQFTTGAPVTVEFDRIDDLEQIDIEQQHLVATALLCAQLLHRVTAEPEQTRPRHIQTLTDIIDQVISSLAVTGSGSREGSEELMTVGASIAQTAFSLLILSDPDDPGFDVV